MTNAIDANCTYINIDFAITDSKLMLTVKNDGDQMSKDVFDNIGER